ncbi:protein flp [Aplysia californica]|uniref:Protein flp n=1 Tax=Aplysia californica TaxID=6500 RepID=A0ABM0K7X5_APLCA|nr:protein flp [Aplysia californica]
MTYCGTVWLTFVVSLSTVLGLQQLTQDSRRELKEFVQAVMKCNDIPGVQIAMTTRNQTVLAEGYGAKKLATGEPMTSSTLQCIGSNTKSFTAMLAALAVQEGKLDWDKPIADYFYKDFKLQSEYRTQQVSIKDLLGHRTGLTPFWGVTIAGLNISFQDVASRMKDFPTKYPFRDRFIYTNYAFVLAAATIEKALGETWYQSVQTRLLDKIGMNSTRFINRMSALDWSNAAFSLYQKKNGIIVEYPETDLINYVGSVCPAGCLFSTAEDMAKWGRFILSGGVTEQGERLVNHSVMNQMFIPSFAITSPISLTRPHFPVASTVDGYGLGLYTGYYRGYKMVLHDGLYNGFHSVQAYLPDLGVGVFVDVPVTGRKQRQVELTVLLVAGYALDILSENEPWLNTSNVCTFVVPLGPAPAENVSPKTTTPLPTTASNPIIGRKKRSLKTKLGQGRVDSRRDTASVVNCLGQASTGAQSTLSTYEGTYSHPAFGDFYIKMEGDKLRYHYGTLQKGELTPTGKPGEFYQHFEHPLEFVEESYANTPLTVITFTPLPEPGSSMAAVITFLGSDYPPTFKRA